MPLTPREKARQRGVKARARAAAIAADPEAFRAVQAEKMRLWRANKAREKAIRRNAVRAAVDALVMEGWDPFEDRANTIPINWRDPNA